MQTEGVKERLTAFIADIRLSQSKFEKECGLSNGYVNNIRQSIQPDKLQRIALKYPALNISWLMIGDVAGDEMYKIPRPTPCEQETRPEPIEETAESVRIRMLEERIKQLTQEKDNYWSLIQTLTAK